MQKFEKYITQSWNNPSLQRQHLYGAGATFEFEEKLKKHYSKKFAITFSNCSTALLALCVSLNLKKNEILTSPINWGGSLAPFLLLDNKVIFSSIEKNSFNLDAVKLPSAFTKKTKVVMSIDYNGLPADSKLIKNFCDSNNLIYISDSAQSFGAYRDEKPAGFFADFIVLSFGPGKSLFGGEGGAILTDNESVYENIIWSSQHPLRHKKTFGVSKFNEYAQINGRLNPFSAILLNEMFDRYISNIDSYQKKSYKLISKLDEEGLIIKPLWLKKSNNSSYFKHQYFMRKKIALDDINYYLGQKYNLKALLDKPKLIPLDPFFINQFKGQFTYPRDLGKNTQFNRIISLIKK